MACGSSAKPNLYAVGHLKSFIISGKVKRARWGNDRVQTDGEKTWSVICISAALWCIKPALMKQVALCQVCEQTEIRVSESRFGNERFLLSLHTKILLYQVSELNRGNIFWKKSPILSSRRQKFKFNINTRQFLLSVPKCTAGFLGLMLWIWRKNLFSPERRFYCLNERHWCQSTPGLRKGAETTLELGPVLSHSLLGWTNGLASFFYHEFTPTSFTFVFSKLFLKVYVWL